MWVRFDGTPSDQVALELLNADQSLRERIPVAQADRRTNRIAVWSVTALEPGAIHPFRITGVGGSESRSSDDIDGAIVMPVQDPTHGLLAVGSCADESAGTQDLLRWVASEEPDAVALIGDTPYIDTPELAKQRLRYAQFLGQPGMAELFSHTPLYSVWDDHDFGQNDTDGRMKGKEQSLKAFKEWHANPSFGNGTEGVYHSFRVGPMEVFMLDTRWFSRTARCAPADAADPVIDGATPGDGASGWTLLGRDQWRWLESGLRASNAPIKLIVSGIVFNTSVRPLKTDYWGMYPEEYQRLLRLIDANPAGATTLVSGDVHASRLVRHTTPAGALVWEVVSSPMHDRVMSSALWVPSPAVVEHFEHPNMMALLSGAVDQGQAILGVKFVDKEGEDFMERELVRASLPPRVAAEPASAAAIADLEAAVKDRTALHGIRRALEPWFMDGEHPAPAAGSLVGARASAEATMETLRQLLAGTTDTVVLTPLGSENALMTAYASPELQQAHAGTPAARDPRTAFYARPAWLPPGGEGPTRSQWWSAVSQNPARFEVLAHGTDEFSVYLASVNGSVRLVRPDGSIRCLLHDGTNERPYGSLAAALVAAGALAPDEASLDGLRALWQRDPATVRAACDRNDRFVWWREVPCERWPQSPFGLTLQAGAAVAVDPSVVPIGSLLLIVPQTGDGLDAGAGTSATSAPQAPRIVYAADCGGAIRGPDRVDLYLGAGDQALADAGRVKSAVRVYRIDQR